MVPTMNSRLGDVTSRMRTLPSCRAAKNMHLDEIIFAVKIFSLFNLNALIGRLQDITISLHILT